MKITLVNGLIKSIYANQKKNMLAYILFISPLKYDFIFKSMIFKEHYVVKFIIYYRFFYIFRRFNPMLILY